MARFGEGAPVCGKFLVLVPLTNVLITLNRCTLVCSTNIMVTGVGGGGGGKGKEAFVPHLSTTIIC